MSTDASRSCSASRSATRADLALARQEDQDAAVVAAERRYERPARPAPRSGREDRVPGSGSRPGTCGPGSRSPAHRPAGRATPAPSRVADITSRRRSSRSTAWLSRAKARPRSASRLRSWNSSKSTPATPSSPGSSRIMRVKTPSVTTSMRVRAETRDSQPHAVADGLADRLAQGRGHARGRRAGGQPPGLEHDQLAAATQGSSSSASGTTVVLPAPGGATRTAEFALDQGAAKRREGAWIGSGRRPPSGRRAVLCSRRRSAAPSAAPRGQGRDAAAELRVPHAVDEIDHDADAR